MDIPAAENNSSSRYHYYSLKHANAKALAKSLNEMLNNKDSKPNELVVAQSRNGQAAIKVEPMDWPVVSADANTNSLLINASSTDYIGIMALIQKLDVAQGESAKKKKETSGCTLALADSGSQAYLLFILLAALAGVSVVRRRKLA